LFQSERLNQKAELSPLKQKLTEALVRLAEREAELAETHLAFQTFRGETAWIFGEADRLASELARSRNEVETFAMQLREREIEFAETKDFLTEAQAERTAALREIHSLTAQRAELDAELTEARAELIGAAMAEARLCETERELANVQERFRSADEGCKSLSICVEELKKEIGTLRRNLSENTAGLELIEARDRLATIGVERDRFASQSDQLATDVRRQEQAAKELDEQIKSLRLQLDEALRAAEEQSEARLREDNEVLRGIVARQNLELEHRHRQLVRLRRAQFALRLVYAIFALGLIAIGVVAVKYVPALRF
jgi:chromosome segregation ATPase